MSNGPPSTMNGLMSLAIVSASAVAATESLTVPVASNRTSCTLRPYVS